MPSDGAASSGTRRRSSPSPRDGEQGDRGDGAARRRGAGSDLLDTVRAEPLAGAQEALLVLACTWIPLAMLMSVSSPADGIGRLRLGSGLVGICVDPAVLPVSVPCAVRVAERPDARLWLLSRADSA